MDFEALGRADKAHKLARYCRQQGWTNEDAMTWDESQWEIIAEQAGLKRPSAKTQGMVVGFLTPSPTGYRAR